MTQKAGDLVGETGVPFRKEGIEVNGGFLQYGETQVCSAWRNWKELLVGQARHT